MHSVQITVLLAASIGAAILAVLLRRPIHQLSVPAGSDPRSRCDRCPMTGSSVEMAVEMATQRVRLGIRCPTCRSFLPTTRVPVEVIAATIGLLTIWHLGLSFVTVAFVWMAAAGTALSIIDVRVHRLPNYLVFPSYTVGLVVFGTAAIVDGTPWNYLRALFAMVLTYGAFFVLHLISPRGLGYGDVKLAGVLGLYLGYLGWPVLVTGLLVGLFANGLAGAALLATGRIKRGGELPFGPFLLGGALVAALGGLDVVRSAFAAMFG